jgi:hypothetical protein
VKHELWVYEYVNRLMRRAPDLAPELTDLFENGPIDVDNFRNIIRLCREAGIYDEVRGLLRHLVAEFRTGQYATGRPQWLN